MYCSNDFSRIVPVVESDYRSPVRRDYGRLIHAPSFRRLQGKTQLYPGIESDFFRNRLTHSIEVAQIAKTIALKLNHEVLSNEGLELDPDLCEFAGLAHDLGHPPFGHQGEEALDEVMRDFGGFEGNAQTLRILSKLEKKKVVLQDGIDAPKDRIGLNLTYRTLATILKYDKVIPILGTDRSHVDGDKPIKGYYYSEKEVVEKIKSAVTNNAHYRGFKTIECRIMDIADDIAYSTYDLEDGLKAGFYHPTTILTYPKEVYEKIAQKVSKAIQHNFSAQDVIDKLLVIFSKVFEIDFLDASAWSLKEDDNGDQCFTVKAEMIDTAIADKISYMNSLSQRIAKDGEFREELTSKLVNIAIEGVYIELDKENLSQSIVDLVPEVKTAVEVLKNFTYESQILSPRLKVAEYRGKQIVKDIFNALSEEGGHLLLPEDFQYSYNQCLSPAARKRCICDFIAGMTDKYAIEFYGRLKSERPETIFKPF